jgi:hypothetical protein
VDAVLVIDTMRRKAVQLNSWFGTNRWTAQHGNDSLDVQPAGLGKNSRRADAKEENR